MENMAVITADDFSAYSIHKEFCPNIYRFAEENFNFTNAHCNIAFCQPSRSVLMTGLYPQNNGSTEFCPIKEGVSTLPNILRAHGYFTALIGKNHHHKPYSVYNWNFEYAPPLHQIPVNYYLKLILNNLKVVIKNQPFFVLINLRYPHRPFLKGHNHNVTIPKFLSNSYIIKQELANYYATVVELDRVFTEIMNLFDNSHVILTSDHGMSFPFVKGNCYHHSTNIPMIYKSKIKKTDFSHIISHVDFTPTILELLEIKYDYKFDGHSYYRILKEEEQNDFKYVYAQLNRMAGSSIRIRSLISEHHSYVINIDTNYPASFVDGWGWQELLKSYKNPTLYKRNREELIELNTNKDVINDEGGLKLNMRKILISLMRKYNDPSLKDLKSFNFMMVE